MHANPTLEVLNVCLFVYVKIGQELRHEHVCEQYCHHIMNFTCVI
uniref:Uncharacterized protein n=1 Tax=Arundo donax TaxID=35708 RepID=A0A0A9F6C1_ARUDO